MEDPITIKRIALLHPAIRYEVLNFYRNEIVLSLTNAFCRFAYTLRTFQEQNNIYAKGRTKLYDNRGRKLGIVTNAKGGQSFHNFGIAIDIVIINGKSASWNTVKDFDGDGIADWNEIVNIFKKHDWEWGGDFVSFKDKSHFQKTFNYSWQELLTKYNNGEFLSFPNSNYIKL